MAIVAIAVGILVIVTVMRAVVAIVVAMFLVATVHDRDTAVAVDGAAVAVVSGNNALGVDSAATGRVAAFVGVT